MSTQSISSPRPVAAVSKAPTWMTARPLWAGLAIISMWLAVLFVGVFGGNIESAGASGTSSVPVVVVVAGVAMITTLVVGRRAFAAGAEDDLRKSLQDEVRAREQLEAEVSALRDSLPG